MNALLRCSECGAYNRLHTVTPSGDGHVCGVCHSALDLSGRPQALTDRQLDRLIASSPIPFLVGFHNCYSSSFHPYLDRLKDLGAAYIGRLVVTFVDTNQSTIFARQLHLDQRPTTLLYNNRQLLKKHVGLPSAMEFVGALHDSIHIAPIRNFGRFDSS